MLSEEVIDKVVERLVNRIEKANTYVLKEIGSSIKQVGTIIPSKRQELIQLLKYGGSYDKIVQKLAQITEQNVYDIYKIFDEIAKNDYRFAEQFYKYRNRNYIPYKYNTALQRQVRALASITAGEYLNLTRTNALGFGLVDKQGNITFKGLQQTYYDLLDEAVLSVSQGKETFDSAMYRQLKNIGESGLKVVYNSTYIDKDGNIKNHTRRLDSAVRMNLKSGLTNLHMEMQKQFGEEFDSDGVEISVHNNPAPDHEDAQGKQFSNEEFDKLQTTGQATTYDKKKIDMFTGKNFRPIGEYNCYHYIFSIVLGVSKPTHTNKELQQIINNNSKGFEYEGQHYTNYQGTQLQRQLETAIRKQKDEYTIGKASNNQELIDKSQENLRILNKKYNELSKVSGLPTKINRLKIAKVENKKN